MGLSRKGYEECLAVERLSMVIDFVRLYAFHE